MEKDTDAELEVGQKYPYQIKIEQLENATNPARKLIGYVIDLSGCDWSVVGKTHG